LVTLPSSTEMKASFASRRRAANHTPYPSVDKAVLFFEVPDLQAAITAIGRSQVVQSAEQWAVLHDPEGHNVLLLQRGSE